MAINNNEQRMIDRECFDALHWLINSTKQKSVYIFQADSKIIFGINNCPGGI
jgi:hypothetical protein